MMHSFCNLKHGKKCRILKFTHKKVNLALKASEVQTATGNGSSIFTEVLSVVTGYSADTDD